MSLSGRVPFNFYTLCFLLSLKYSVQADILPELTGPTPPQYEVLGVAEILNAFGSCSLDLVLDDTSPILSSVTSAYSLRTLTTFDQTREINYRRHGIPSTESANHNTVGIRYKRCLLSLFTYNWKTSITHPNALWNSSHWRPPQYPRFVLLLTEEQPQGMSRKELTLQFRSVVDRTAAPVFWLVYTRTLAPAPIHDLGMPASSLGISPSELAPLSVKSIQVMHYGIAEQLQRSPQWDTWFTVCSFFVEFTPVTCTSSSSSCVKQMMHTHNAVTNNGKNITWYMELAMNVAYVAPTSNLKSRGTSYQSLTFDPVQATLQLLTTFGNTAAGLPCDPVDAGTSFNAVPNIFADFGNVVQRNDLGVMMITGGANNYRFFTNRVNLRYQNIFQVYLEPFKFGVWLLLIIATLSSHLLLILFKLALSKLKLRKSRSSKPIGHLWSTLIDQPAPLKSLNSCMLTFKVLAFSWPIPLFLLTSCYKSILKSDFVTPVQVQPGFGSIFEGVISNASVYYITSHETCELYFHHNETSKHVYDLCKTFGDEPAPDECQFLHETRSLHGPIGGYGTEPPGVQNLLKVKKYLEKNMKYTCHGTVFELIRNGSIKTTASIFITSEKEFVLYGNMIQEASKQAGYHVVPNGRAREEFSTTPRGFYISDGVHENLKYVKNRMSALLQSGIYWFWEKWHTISLNRKGKRYARKQGPSQVSHQGFAALSLADSRVLAVLNLVAIGNFVGLVTFFVEYVFKSIGN